MQGRILELNAADGSGLALGADGNRYRFGVADWRGQGRPIVGSEIDFLPADTWAREMFPLAGAAALRSVTVQPLAVAQPNDNSVVLGWIGIACLVVGFIIPLLPWIAAFILGLVGADGAKRTRNGTGLIVSRIAWIGAVALTIAAVGTIALGVSMMAPLIGEMMKSLPANSFT